MRLTLCSARYAIIMSLLISPIAAYCATPDPALTNEADSASLITHVPVPVAVKGRPLPIIAGINDSAGEVKSVTLQFKSSETAKTTKIDMTAVGEGRYEAIIPPKSTAGEGLLYQITAVGANGTDITAWFPVKPVDVKDQAREQAKDETSKTSRIAKAKAAMVTHPYITAAAGVGVVGVTAVAVSGGGGGGGGGDSSEPSPYEGTLSGTWSGPGVGGHFTVNVSSSGAVTGSYSGTLSGSLSGSVAHDGSFSASGSAGGAVWSGQVTGSAGSFSASGTWTGYGISGSWSGSGG